VILAQIRERIRQTSVELKDEPAREEGREQLLCDSPAYLGGEALLEMRCPT
jgi:hypothetical protein